MGFIELEQFRLRTGTSMRDFIRLDAEFQVWSYLHRDGLVRRTTALGDDGTLVVLTIFAGAVPPMPPDVGDDDGALAAFNEAIDDATYERRVFKDLD